MKKSNRLSTLIPVMMAVITIFSSCKDDEKTFAILSTKSVVLQLGTADTVKFLPYSSVSANKNLKSALFENQSTGQELKGEILALRVCQGLAQDTLTLGEVSGNYRTSISDDKDNMLYYDFAVNIPQSKILGHLKVYSMTYQIYEQEEGEGEDKHTVKYEEVVARVGKVDNASEYGIIITTGTSGSDQEYTYDRVWESINPLTANFYNEQVTDPATGATVTDQVATLKIKGKKNEIFPTSSDERQWKVCVYASDGDNLRAEGYSEYLAKGGVEWIGAE